MVTQHDATPPDGRKRQGKRKRTNGVGRTGARFPAADGDGSEVSPELDDSVAGVLHEPYGSGGAAPDVPREPEPSAAEPTELSTEDGSESRTGARYGKFSKRRSRRAKRSAAEDAPDIPDESAAERTQPMIRPWSGALVRPYAHTGGRTRSSRHLAIEALISTNTSGGAGVAALTTHHRRMIVDLCVQPRSVAEVAALLSVPLGVARVLLGDLAVAGAVIVHPTAGDDAPDLEFMHRVLCGLRKL